MGNTQTNGHRHTEKKHHHRARHTHGNTHGHSKSRQHHKPYTRKQRGGMKQSGGFWPFSKKEDATTTVEPATSDDKCASCPVECRGGLPNIAGLKSGFNDAMGQGEERLTKFTGSVKGRASEKANEVGNKLAGIFGKGEPAGPPAVVAEAQEGGRRRKGRKTNRRRKHSKKH